MGVVYLTNHRLNGRQEALKVMSQELMKRPGVLDRFLCEIRAVVRLDHKNIVRAYTAMRLGESLALAMEYVPGYDLAKLVKAKGPLRVDHACVFTAQAAEGLQHAYEKDLVHRDIKPHNLILVVSKGSPPVVKILDFGLAKALSQIGDERGLTRADQALGTPDYIAPEQALDAQKADIRADIYSLGCTLYHLLTGSPPFDGNSQYEIFLAHHSTEAKPLSALRPEVPEGLSAVVARMMAKKPEDRFQTPIEVVRALAPYVKHAKPPEPAPPPPPSEVEPIDEDPPLQILEIDTEEPLGGAKPQTPKKQLDSIAPNARQPLIWVAGAGVAAAALIALVGAWSAGLLTRGAATGVKATPPPIVSRKESTPKTPVAVISTKANASVADRNEPLKKIEPPETSPAQPPAGFAAMFAGPSLEGWTDELHNGSEWRSLGGGVVEGTDLNQRGVGGPAVLTTDRLDFENFHLLAKILHTGGDANVLVVRRKAGDGPQDRLSGYAVSVGGTSTGAAGAVGVPVGSIAKIAGLLPGGIHTYESRSSATPVAVGTWVSIEVIAEGKRITTKVNGRPAAEYSDDSDTFSNGAITLGCRRASSLRIKDVFIKILPGRAPVLVQQPDPPTPSPEPPKVELPPPVPVKPGLSLYVARPGHQKAVSAVAFAPDGRYFASAGDGVRVWDEEGNAVRVLASGFDTLYRAVAWCRNGSYLVAGNDRNEVRIWEDAKGEPFRVLKDHQGPILALAISDDGRWLASASADKTVRLWNILAGSELTAPLRHTSEVRAVAFRGDGKAVASTDGVAVKVWSTETGKLDQTFEEHEGTVLSVAFSPDGARLASCGQDGTIRIWDLARGTDVKTLTLGGSPPRQPIRRVAFSPGGRRLASAGDRGVTLWDLDAGLELSTLSSDFPRKGINGLAYSRDGQRLVSGGEDRRVMIWTVTGPGETP
jgi:WD40 repeat protein/serine/threonine protein kinase